MVYFQSCILVRFRLPSVPLLDEIVSVITGGFLRHQCQHTPLRQRHVDTAVVLSMLSLQVVRRLYECFFVSVFSDARIHLLHYVLGLFFYPAVALTALLHVDTGSKLNSLNVKGDCGTVIAGFKATVI